jgi:hypothetical protein
VPAVLKAIADLNVSPFEAAMGRIQARTDKFAKGQLAALGHSIGSVFAVGAVTAFAKSVGEAADTLDDTSAALGVNAERLQTLNVLFTKNGQSAADVSAILARLRKNSDEATKNGSIANDWKRLGFEFEEIANLPLDEKLVRIFAVMASGGATMEQGEAAGNLLGRRYADLQAIAEQLTRSGLDPLRDSLLSTNEIMREDSVKAAAAMYEAYETAGRKIKTLASRGLTTAAGGLVAFTRAGMEMTPEQKRMRGTLMATNPLLGFLYQALRGNWKVASEDLFGKPKNILKSPAEVAAMESNTAAIKAAAEKAKRQAEERATDIFNKAVSKITVTATKEADTLAKMGGYIGGQATPAGMIQERILKIAELQKELQERIAAAAQKTAEHTEAISVSVED